MAESHEKFELILLSKAGNVLFKEGDFDTEDEARGGVNAALRSCPNGANWKVIRVLKEVVSEGTGHLPEHQSEPAPSGRARWW